MKTEYPGVQTSETVSMILITVIERTIPPLSFQIAGLLSAIIVMIVTLAIGFLLEPLPKVKFRSIPSSTKIQTQNRLKSDL